MKKKTISILMAALLTMTATLTGCGNTDNSENSVSDETQKEQTTTEEPAAPAYELLDSLNKKEGDELTIPRSNYVSYPVEDTGDTLTVWMEYWASDAAASANETLWAKNWQEMTGIKVEFIQPTEGSSSDEFSTMIASGSLPDIIVWEWTNNYTGGPAAAEAEGVLTILDDYVQPYGAAADLWQYLQDNPTVDREVKNDDGHYYCFPFIRGNTYLQCTTGPMYRADLLEKAGYTGKLETLDDWEAALTALKEYGIEKPMVVQSLEYLMRFMGSAYGIRAGMYVDDQTGEIKNGYTQEAYKELMKRANDWVEKGLLDADLLTCDKKTAMSYIMNDQAAVTVGAGGSFLGSMIKSVAADPQAYNPDFKMATASFPVMNSGDTVLYGGGSYDYATTSNGSAVITADCKNPELAAKFLNYCYSQSGHYMINYGKEGEAYTMVDGIPTYTDEIMHNPNGWSVSTAMTYNGLANGCGPFVQDANYIFQYYETDEQKQALHDWADGNESQRTLIPPITLKEDESKQYSVLSTQMNTFISEYSAKFYTQVLDVDTEWDNYIKQLNDTGMNDMIGIYQSALDRYNER